MDVIIDLDAISPIKITCLNSTLTDDQVSDATRGSKYPNAPLVTAIDTGEGFKIRILAFSTGPLAVLPTVGVDAVNNNYYVQFAGSWIPDSLKTAWYIEFLHTSAPVETIRVYCNYTDPKTSRGTITSVQPAEPKLV